MKSGRGGRRPGAGRKPKGDVPPGKLADLDLRAALASPVPDDIAAVAQGQALSALAALVKQLTHGTSEAAKIGAANAILDRGYGKPTVETGGDLLLPFMAKPESTVDLGSDVRAEARRYATLAIEALSRIASTGASESARVSAAKSLWDRGLGTVAPAKLPDTLRPGDRPMGKKEEMARAASAAATGRYAVPSPPSAVN